MIRFLISCPRLHEKDACIEARYMFSSIDISLSCKRTRIPGLVLGSLKEELDLPEVIEKLKDLLQEEAYGFHFVLKLTPLELFVPSTLEEILNATSQLKDKIKKGEKFKIELQKRFTTLRSADIIQEVASLIEHDVDLSNPDKILLIQIVGEHTGLSVLKPNDIISVVKLKR